MQVAGSALGLSHPAHQHPGMATASSWRWASAAFLWATAEHQWKAWQMPSRLHKCHTVHAHMQAGLQARAESLTTVVIAVEIHQVLLASVCLHTKPPHVRLPLIAAPNPHIRFPSGHQAGGQAPPQSRCPLQLARPSPSQACPAQKFKCMHKAVTCRQPHAHHAAACCGACPQTCLPVRGQTGRVCRRHPRSPEAPPCPPKTPPACEPSA